jgi:hypothetical protein
MEASGALVHHRGLQCLRPMQQVQPGIVDQQRRAVLALIRRCGFVAIVPHGNQRVETERPRRARTEPSAVPGRRFAFGRAWPVFRQR